MSELGAGTQFDWVPAAIIVAMNEYPRKYNAARVQFDLTVAGMGYPWSASPLLLFD